MSRVADREVRFSDDPANPQFPGFRFHPGVQARNRIVDVAEQDERNIKIIQREMRHHRPIFDDGDTNHQDVLHEGNEAIGVEPLRWYRGDRIMLIGAVDLREFEGGLFIGYIYSVRNKLVRHLDKMIVIVIAMFLEVDDDVHIVGFHSIRGYPYETMLLMHSWAWQDAKDPVYKVVHTAHLHLWDIDMNARAEFAEIMNETIEEIADNIRQDIYKPMSMGSARAQ